MLERIWRNWIMWNYVAVYNKIKQRHTIWPRNSNPMCISKINSFKIGTWTRVYHKPHLMCCPSLRSHLKDLLRLNLLSCSHTWLLASSATFRLFGLKSLVSPHSPVAHSRPYHMDFFNMVDCFIKARNSGECAKRT